MSDRVPPTTSTVAPQDAATRAREIALEAIDREANQKENELSALLELLAGRELRTVVEIGTARGGTFYAWCRLAAPDALLVSIDLPGGPFGGGYAEEDVARFREFAQPGQELHFLRVDSHDPGTLAALERILAGRRIDFLFIDGDHAYYGARTDFERYAPLVAADGLIAFHDIVPHRDVPEAKVDVLWRELKTTYEHVEFVERGDDRGWGPWGGIGVLFNPPRSGRTRPLSAAARLVLMEDVRRARAQSAERETQLQEADAVRAELAARVERLEADVAALGAERDGLTRQVEELSEAGRRVESERDRAGAVAEALEAERQAERLRFAEERGRSQAERQRLEEERARLLEELERAAVEHSRLSAALAAERGRAEEAIAAERRQGEEALVAEREARAVEREAAARQLSALGDEAQRGRDAETFLALVLQTRGWRMLESYRRMRTSLRQQRSRLRPRPSPAPAGGPGPLVDAQGPPLPTVPDPGEIVLPAPGEPTISIVVPVYENLELTLRCLASLAATIPGDAEVIVVDDGSGVATTEALARVHGLRLVRKERNTGFLDSCNRGAAEAGGDYIVFLNNDTEVTSGWLEALVDAASSAPRVGAVGSKLVYPDGSLQEAGGVIWSDASGLNFGRGDDPAAPEYNFRREVDYCSAASLLVRRDVFERLRGFDERFSPGYYEDTDFCFALRREGYTTLYEPGSVVVHHEGATHGTDERAGLENAFSKANQHRNRHRFQAKWRAELQRHWPPGTAGGRHGGRVERRPHVLVADTWVPTHDRDSGSLRMTWILRLLRSLGCAVTLYPLNCYRHEPYASQFQRLGIEVTYAPHTFPVLAERRRDLYDVVVLSRPNVASELLDLARGAFPRAALVYDSVDLHFVRDGRKLELLGEPQASELAEARALELECIRRSDITAAITEVEAAVIEEHVPGTRTVVLPNVHEVDAIPPLPRDRRSDLLFIGGFQHEPNVDAVLYLMEEVYPLIAAELDVRVVVLGSDPPEELRRLQSPNVVVTGYLPDVDEFFRRARVFVAPLRYGAGMKGKIGHALAFGLPVVTTPIGAEGMDLVDGEHALIRSGPEEFAEAVVTAYRDAEVWQRLADAGQQLVFERWTPAAMRQRLERLLRDVAVVPTAGGR